MKIAFVSNQGGGLDTYVLEAGLWLSRHGHTVHVIYVGRKPRLQSSERYAQLRFHHAPVSRIPYYLSRLKQKSIYYLSPLISHYVRTAGLARVLHEIRASDGLDFVEIPEGYAGAKQLGGIPFIYRMHGAEWVFRRYCEDGTYHPLVERMQARMMRAARQRHAVSHAYATFIAGALKIPPREIDVIRYPIDFAQFPSSSSAPEYEPPPHKPPFKLLNVGRLERRKGVHTLIEAMPKVWEHEPETTLTLYGRDADFGRPQIEAAIPPETHRGRLIFGGFIPREALIQQYYQSHLYVGPTRFESSGLHLQEAMSAARPVIGTQMGPLPEFIRHEESGWLVPLDDAKTLANTIVHALNQPEKRETFGREGRRISQKMFDLDMIMNEQVELYKRDFT